MKSRIIIFNGGVLLTNHDNSKLGVTEIRTFFGYLNPNNFKQSSNKMNNGTTNSTIPPSVFSKDYTYVEGAYMCVAWMYPIHIGFAYLVALMGLGAMVTRLFNRIKFLHVWFGRFFMIFMFCCMATSLVIYNTGLPTAIIVFFVLLTIGQSVGWLAIKIHVMIMEKQALKMVQDKLMKLIASGAKFQVKEEKVLNKEDKLKEGKHETHSQKTNDASEEENNHSENSDENEKQEQTPAVAESTEFNPNVQKKEVEDAIVDVGIVFNISSEIAKAKGEIANSKGFFGRFFSMKSLHALGMFIAWWNIFGRAMVTDPTKWDGCWAYPAFKNPSGVAVYAPEVKPGSSFISNVPLFVSVAFLPGFLGFIAIGFVYSLTFGLIAWYKQSKLKKQTNKL
jgi:hypothetical protein